METNIKNRKQNLETLLNQLTSLIGPNVKRYFHINTIENLIFHFDEIKTENDKIWIYQSLVDYFTMCSEYAPYIDRDKSKSLFYEHLDKITDYYHNNLGFSVLINRTVVYLFYIVILLLSYSYLNLYVAIAITLLLVLQTVRTFNKYRIRRVYGLFW